MGLNKSLRNYSLRELRAFCIAVEQGSFRAAAERLFLTASAISHQVRNLEAGLGIQLFERSTRALKSTAAGENLYNDVRPLIDDFDAVIAKHARTVGKQQLRVSVQPFFASEWFVPRLADFMDAHPDLDITVDTSDESVERHPMTAEVSIRIYRSPPGDLVSHRLLKLRLVPAGSPRFYDQVKVRAGKIVSEFPLILHESRPKAWRQWERSSGISLPAAPSTMRLASMIAVVRAAERSLGAALVPAGLSDALFHSDVIVPLFDHELETDEDYYVVYRPEDGELPHVAAFTEWVLQEFGDAR